MNQLERLSSFISSSSYDDFPSDLKEKVLFCVLDTAGAILGARNHPDVIALTNELTKWSGNSNYSASIWGRNMKTDVHTAVLINSMAGHTLEMDDGHGRSKAHIGVVVVPAAWAVAETVQASGKEFLEACVVGYETMTRIGIAMDVASNRKRGWHTTGIIGTFGAAAVASKLLKLDTEQTANALGIAATQSAGLWAFLAEGSNLKKLNPARAAVNGVEAAIMAKAGMTGPRHALDAEDGGLYRAVSDNFNMDEVCSGLGSRWEIEMIEKKLYPSCASTHHAVDAAVELFEKGIKPEDIESVLIECGEVAYIQCGSTEYPKSWVEAKFSIPFTFASALKYGTLTNESFSTERLSDPELIRLAGKVQTTINPEYTKVYPGKLMGKAIVTLKNGLVDENEMDGMVGSPMKPISGERVKLKYLGLMQPAFEEKEAREYMKRILNLEHEPVVFSF